MIITELISVDDFITDGSPSINETVTGRQLTCSTGGTPAYAFTWKKTDHGLISPSSKYSITGSGYTGSVLTIIDATSEDSGNYTCTYYTYYGDFESVSISRTLDYSGMLHCAL